MDYEHTTIPETGRYCNFPIDSLVDNSVTDFDLFLQLHEHFILYSGNGYRWERSELTSLLSAGYSFYIRNDDLPKAEMYRTLNALPKIDQTLAPPERIKTIEQVGAKFIQCLYDGELTEASVSQAEKLGQSIVDCLQEDRTAIKALSGLAQHDYYTYYHSVRVSTYAVAIAIQMGLSDETQLKSIALGGIFHDVGKKEVPLEILNKSGALNDDEWGLIRSHPSVGHELIEEKVLDHVPREIILHHHEKLNGSGYPHNLKKNDLLPEVQIATLADIFDALTSSRSYQTRRTRYEALDFIKHRLLHEEICTDAFKALVMCLAT